MAVTLTCVSCGRAFDVPPSLAKRRKTCGRAECRLTNGPVKYESEAERKAAHNARERARRAERRPKRTRPLRPHDTHPDRIVCAAPSCDKLLTVAAVAGGSEHCSREHAGFPPVASAFEAELRAAEDELLAS